MVDLTVLVPSIPERAEMRGEAIRSAITQCRHLVSAVDDSYRGFVPTVNRLATRVMTEWLMILCDDDLLDPEHVATLAPHFDSADVVYSWCRVEGRDWSPNRYAARTTSPVRLPPFAHRCGASLAAIGCRPRAWVRIGTSGCGPSMPALGSCASRRSPGRTDSTKAGTCRWEPLNG